jgi:hypothetical protein
MPVKNINSINPLDECIRTCFFAFVRNDANSDLVNPYIIWNAAGHTEIDLR